MGRESEVRDSGARERESGARVGRVRRESGSWARERMKIGARERVRVGQERGRDCCEKG